ncbi:MAG: hypothetical protein MUP14_02395 [Dehalococcoidia bacterium]|nr:hypothetical protein [Dehalococcoidia bacterium]
MTDGLERFPDGSSIRWVNGHPSEAYPPGEWRPYTEANRYNMALIAMRAWHQGRRCGGCRCSLCVGTTRPEHGGDL